MQRSVQALLLLPQVQNLPALAQVTVILQVPWLPRSVNARRTWATRMKKDPMTIGEGLIHDRHGHLLSSFFSAHSCNRLSYRSNQD